MTSNVLESLPMSRLPSKSDQQGCISILPPQSTLKAVDNNDAATKSFHAWEWTGPDDPANPQNWSLAKRIYHTILPGLFGFTVTFATSIYTPGYPDVMEQFGVGATVALLPLSLYTLGLAFGPVLAAPLSETHGRRAVYLITFPAFALFILGCGFANTFATLVICRFFAGVFGSPPLAIGAGSNSDVWRSEHYAVAATLFITCPFLGPAFGPVVGGFVAEYKGWRWTQWCILFVSVAVYVLAIFTSETYKKTILQKRAKWHGLEPLTSGAPTGIAAVKFLITVTLFRPIHMLLKEPIVAALSFYVSFNFAVLFAFFASFPLVFESLYGFDRGQTGLTFLSIAVGCLLAAATVIAVDKVLYQKLFRRSTSEGKGGIIAPEHRLYSAMIGSIGLPIGLFWFAWTARSDVHWVSPVLAAVPFAWGNLSIFASTALYLIDTYASLNAASAMAANGLLRYTMGAAFPLFTVQMYGKLGIHWATSLLAFVATALLPIPWVLFRWGPQLRNKSGYDTIKI